MAAWIAFGLLALTAVGGGLLLFRTRSMVRSAMALLLSCLAVAGLLLLLGSELLAAATLLMMVGEAGVMVLFMAAFRRDPGSLAPAPAPGRGAALAGGALFVLLAAIALTTDFPAAPRPPAPELAAAIGRELLGPALLPFESAAVTLLAAMVAVIATAARRGRFGDAAPAGDDAAPHHHP